MNIQEKIQVVKANRDKLTTGQKQAFGNYKSMMRNIQEEDGRLGGETHVSPDGIKQFDSFLDKCISCIKSCRNCSADCSFAGKTKKDGVAERSNCKHFE